MKQKFYLTKDGLKKLKNDFAILQSIKQGKLNQEAPLIFDSDELNSEFVVFKEDLDRVNAKIEEIEYIIHNYELIEKPKNKEERERVGLGAKVLLDINDEEDEFFIVGTLEANPSLGRISNESPVGKLLLGKKAGDEAVLASPARVKYKIKKVNY